MKLYSANMPKMDIKQFQTNRNTADLLYRNLTNTLYNKTNIPPKNRAIIIV